MPIIKRLNINEFKVVSFFSDPGVLEESTGNSWTLDPKTSSAPFGTEDFNGVARTSVLLARLESITLNTGILPFNQFQQLQPNALALYFPVIQDIGWVEIGRSVASVYYEDCSQVISTDPITDVEAIIPGRLPVSKNYFDLDRIGIQLYRGDIPIVSGEGFGPDALRIIQTYNPRLGLGPNDPPPSFGPNPINYPAIPIMGSEQYLPLIITEDGVARLPAGVQNAGDVVTLKADIRPIILQLAYRSGVETPGDPIYEGIDSDVSAILGEPPVLFDDGKKLRWGKPRRRVERAFSVDITGPVQGSGGGSMWESGKNNRTEGECILYPNLPTERKKKTGTGTRKDGPINLGNDDYNYWSTLLDPDIPTVGRFCEGCPTLDKIPINFPPFDVINTNENKNNLFSFTYFPNPGVERYVQAPNEDNSNMLRGFNQFLSSIENIRDPREFLLESVDSPPGYFYVLFNKKTCSFDVFPALRDKDGDIPEPIGSSVAYYMQDIRDQITKRFYLSSVDNVLKTLYTGSDGYMRYSDGKSYKELLGESVLGCGDYFSFDMIPEVFVELYPVNESQEIKDYRMLTERPTKIPWPLPAPERTHDQNYISDIIKDLTIGIPDADIANTQRSLIPIQDKYVAVLEGGAGWGFPIHTIVPDYLRAHTPGFWYEPSWYTEQEIDNGELNRGINIYFAPSRWKSTIRPIYHKIYEDTELLKDPRWSKYISYEWYLDIDGNKINSSGTRYLGKMDALPWKDTPWKDPHTLGDYAFRSKIADGYGKIIYDVLDDAISNRIFYGEDESEEVRLDNGMKSHSLFDYMKIGRIFNSFMDTLNTPLKNWRSENVTDLIAGGAKLVESVVEIEEVIEKLIEDPKAFNEGLADIPANLMSDFVVSMMRNLVETIYSAISYEYSRKNPERTSLSPLRIFKKGGVVLRSRSGYYFHDKEPCPIIFLGFNDTKKVNIPLEELSKEDIEDTIYFNSSNRYYMNAGRPKKIESMPIIKRRNKKYGINPLLDIFYLNIAEKSKENPGISAFRPGSASEMMGGKSNWPDFSRGQYPYMFPPVWNEPSDSPGTPSMEELGLKEGAQWGDLAWRNRKPNIIIPLENRWSLSLKSDDYNEDYAILTDKTPILDIYNMLMEMHVKGVSWKIINNYIVRSKLAISGNRYSEKIDLDILETIYQELLSILDNHDAEKTSKFLNTSEPISLSPVDWGLLYFYEKDENNLTRKIIFRIPNDKDVYIDEIKIESNYSENIKDAYGNDASNLFKIKIIPGSGGWMGGIPKGPQEIYSVNLPSEDGKPGIPLRPIPGHDVSLYSFDVEFKNEISTSDLSIQPMFEYCADLIIRGNIGSPDGEKFEAIARLTAMLTTGAGATDTDYPYYDEPIYLSKKINFNFVDENDQAEQTIFCLNYNDVDSVKIISMKFINLFIGINRNGSLEKINSKLFDSGDKDNFFKINFSPIEIPPTEDVSDPDLYTFKVIFKPDTNTTYPISKDSYVFYEGQLIVEYEHGNFGKKDRSIKTRTIPVNGYTKKQ